MTDSHTLANARVLYDAADNDYKLFADDVLLLSASLPHEILLRTYKGKLSRFASVRYQDSKVMLVSPIGYEIVIRDLRILQVIFGGGESIVSPAVTTAIWSFLNCAGMTDTDDAGYDAWTYTDAVTAYGLNDPRPTRIKTPPIQSALSETSISLAQGDPDLPLYQLLRKRRTYYNYGAGVMTIDQLGEFLFYSARVQEFVEGVNYDTTTRLYPSAGAVYELELYVLAHECKGLARKLYHYDPSLHSLELLRLATTEYEGVINQVIASTGYQLVQPQVIFFMTARMRRINWKNRALALAYQDAGVLLQTFYLSATAMDLAPCALGGFKTDALQKISGVNAVEEPLLAVFLLGASQ